MTRVLRVGAVVAALVGGLVTGLAAVLVHERPAGLLLGLAATVATLVAVPGGVRRLAFVVGWVAVLALAAIPRPEGDYLVAADLPGYLLLAAAPVLVVVALVTFPPPRRPVTRCDGSASTPGSPVTRCDGSA